MAVPKGKPPIEKATIEQVLARFLQRDEEHHAAWQAVTSTQNDHRRLLEAMQVDIQRMTRVLEKQDGINERQIKLAETTQTHGDTFGRAFSDMKDMRAEFTAAIREFSGVFHDWRKAHEGENDVVSKTVTGYGGALKLGTVVLGTILLLVGAVATTWRTQLMADMDRLESGFERRKIAIDLRLDTLSQQVQEVRLSRERDIENKNTQAPKP